MTFISGLRLRALSVTASRFEIKEIRGVHLVYQKHVDDLKHQRVLQRLVVAPRERSGSSRSSTRPYRIPPDRRGCPRFQGSRDRHLPSPAHQAPVRSFRHPGGTFRRYAAGSPSPPIRQRSRHRPQSLYRPRGPPILISSFRASIVLITVVVFPEPRRGHQVQKEDPVIAEFSPEQIGPAYRYSQRHFSLSQ